MPKRKRRIIIDTNLWISFLLTKNFVRLERILVYKSIVLLFSQELLDEFVEVAFRPKFQKYFTSSDIQDLLLQIRLQAKFINVVSTVSLPRDAKDNFLLALAKDGKANYLLAEIRIFWLSSEWEQQEYRA